MLWKWYESKLVRVEDMSPTVKRFWLEWPEDEEGEQFTFEAGQFITLDLPIADKRTKRWRSYSIANAPEDNDLIELCIVNLEGGVGTTYLFEDLKVGEKVKFKGPSGTFTLPKQIDKDLVLVCTGTGVAPFRSMLRHIQNQQIPHKKIHLIYGTRHSNNILYKEEFEELETTMDDFKYSVALSREEYKGYQGYVHDIYKKEYGEVSPDRKFYLCGWSNMIDDAVETLILELKYDKSQVLYELYD
jgi:CDP-4-dehydro-6-deoxyglucose reductase